MPLAPTVTAQRPRPRPEDGPAVNTAPTKPAGRKAFGARSAARSGQGRSASKSTPQGTDDRARRTPKPATIKPKRTARRPERRLSALDAAALVLGSVTAKEAAQGLSADELIQRMERAKLWTSPSGKTPAATLYAAMLREAAARGTGSRFRRIGPGRFTRGPAPRRPAAANRSASPTPHAPHRRGAGAGAGTP